MNNVIQNMLDRHSCRAFTDQPIEQEKINDLITAALWAPSSNNCQTWHFTMITNTEKIQRLASAVREADSRPANYNFFAPAAFFIVSGERDNRNCFLDGAAAMENVLLAATSLGLGSCWINQVRDVCDNPQVRAILTEYGVPENHIVNASAAIGYAAKPAVVHERKANLVSIVD
ncbi:MAG: nitroreductase [Clostridia bacterium]|nr:nitroreductase [Clostridia bacterium]